MLNCFGKFVRYAIAGLLGCGVLFLCGCPGPMNIGGEIELTDSQGRYRIKHKLVWDPPGSYLVDFDATQALLNLSLSNATISSTSGTATASIKDLTTGQIVAAQNFGYVVRGNSLFAQDPTAVYNWLQQFTAYASIDVITDVSSDVQTTNPGSASSTASVLYQGTTYASGTVSWQYKPPPAGGGGCHTRICPNQ